LDHPPDSGRRNPGSVGPRSFFCPLLLLRTLSRRSVETIIDFADPEWPIHCERQRHVPASGDGYRSGGQCEAPPGTLGLGDLADAQLHGRTWVRHLRGAPRARPDPRSAGLLVAPARFWVGCRLDCRSGDDRGGLKRP